MYVRVYMHNREFVCLQHAGLSKPSIGHLSEYPWPHFSLCGKTTVQPSPLGILAKFALFIINI